jgi:hypothetical protein
LAVAFFKMLLAILIAGVAAVWGAADGENPFKKAAVGDRVEYETGVAAGGGSSSGRLKIVLTAKSEREATVRQVPIDKNGKEQPAQVLKVDLTRPLVLCHTCNFG